MLLQEDQTGPHFNNHYANLLLFCRYVYGEDSEPFIFSFFQDVSQNPAVIKAMLAVNHTVQKATTLLNK